MSSAPAERGADLEPVADDVVVCLKHAARRVAVDPLTAAVTVDPHDVGLSAADEAALELALRLGRRVTAVTAGPAAAEESLRAAAAVGAHRLVRCPGRGDESSRHVADALAPVARTGQLVLCGDYRADRGSGSVPGFLAAELGVAQALGVVRIEPGPDGGLHVHRRLDRGRREVLRLGDGAVVSVEGAVVRLRRAPLRGVVAARDATVELGPAVAPSVTRVLRPHRPRVQARPAPSPDATPHQRIAQVTQATATRTPPRLLTLEPGAAAEQILDQLRAWGYLPDAGS